MSRTWWVRRLFGRRPSFAGRRPAARPRLVGLEDRSVPANLITVQAGGLPAIPAGASDFADTDDYVIAPIALAGAAADVVFRANAGISFLAPVALGVSLDAESKAGIVVAADIVAAGKTVTLTAAGTVEQTGGQLVADKLVAISTGGGVFLGDVDADRQVPAGTPTFFFNTLGTVAGKAAGDFTLTAVGPLTVTAPGVGAGGRVTIALAADALLTVAGPVSAAAGNATLYADDLELTAPVSAPAVGTPDQPLVGNVQLFTSLLGEVSRPITLGGTAPGTLSLTQAELDLTAGRLVQVGDGNAGPLTLAGPVAAPPGFTRLVLAAGGAITQAAGAGLTVAELAVAPLGAGPATLTDPANDVRVVAALGGGPGGVDVRFATKGDLTVGRVGLIAGVTGNVVEIVAAGKLTVDAPDTKGTPAEPFSARGFGTDGPLLLSAGTDLTVAPGNTLAAAGGATLRVGQAAAGVLTLPGGALTAASATTIEGGAFADTFNLGGSAKSKISIDGKGPALPAAPGDTLNYAPATAALTVTYTGLADGTLTEAGVQPVQFVSVESLNPGPAGVTVVGGAADEVVWLYKPAGQTFYKYSNDAGGTFGNPVPVGGGTFGFVGNGGRDVLKVDYTKGGDPLAGFAGGVGFDGTDKAGDLLAMFGTGGFDARYVATAAGAGRVEVTDAAGAGLRTVTYANLFRLDLTGFGLVTVAPAGAVDKLTVTEEFDFLTGKAAALLIEELAAWNNGELRIEASGAGGTITIAKAANAHANVNLTFVSETITVNGNVAAAGTVRFTNTGVLTLGAVIVSGVTGVFQDGGGPVVLAGDAKLTSAAGAVSVGSAVDAEVAGTGSLTVTAATVATLSKSVGASKGPASLSVTAPAIALGGATYKTTGDQKYAGPVAVSAPAVDFDSQVGGLTFTGTLRGALANVTAATFGSGTGTLFGDQVGTLVRLRSLAVLRGPTTIAGPAGGAVTTAGPQSYAGPVVLAADAVFTATNPPPAGPGDPPAGDITFQSALDAAVAGKSLARVNTPGGGTATFGGAVGGTAALALLTTDAPGRTVIGGGLVRTTGPQAYGDPVTLAETTQFVGLNPPPVPPATLPPAGDIAFLAALDAAAAGGQGAEVITPGLTTFAGPVGGGFALKSLATDAPGNTRVAGGLVRTVGDQTFNDPVTAGPDAAAAVRFESVTAADATAVGTGTVTFAGTLDGPAAVVVTTAGGTAFAKAVGGTTPLAALTADGGGKALVAGGSVTTAGGQTYADDVVLGKDTVFTAGGDVTFAGKLDSTDGGQGATINTPAATTFGGAVGGTALAFLTTDAAGTTAVNGGVVTTTGSQTFNDPVTVGANATFTAAGPAGGVTFAGTLDSAGPVGGFGAAVNTPGGGTTTFGGPVGGSKALAFLTTDAPGKTVVGGGLVSATGDQTFNDPVAATSDVRFQTVTPAGTVPGVGAVRFLDPSAAGLSAAGFVVVVRTDGPVVFEGGVTAGSLLVDRFGTIDLNGGTVTTAGEQLYAGDVVLTEDAVLTATVVTFGRRVDADDKANWALTVTGGVAFNGKVGEGTPGFGRQALGAVTVNGPAAVSGGLVQTTGKQTFNGPVRADKLDAAFRSVAAKDYAAVGPGGITFAGTLDGPTGATVTTAGLTAFGGAVGGKTPLAFLTADGGGATLINGGSVTTAGPQTFSDDVRLGADATFTATLPAGGVTFAGKLDAAVAGKQGAAVNTPGGGATTFSKAVGTTALAFLTTDTAGTTAVNGGVVTTTGPQTYADPVTVGATAVFTAAAAVTFNGTLAGPFDVTANSPADTTFGGPVTARSLTTDAPGRTVVGGGGVTTTAGQTYGDPVAVTTRDATFAGTGGGAITFASTLDGPAGATVNTAGPATFTGAVGGGSPLAFLTTDAGGTTTVSGGLVRTAGPQAFGDDVTVRAATTFAAGAAVTFGGTLAGPFDVTANSPADTRFGGAVDIGSLTTDGAGRTVVATAAVTTAAAQRFGDPVVVETGVTFAGGSVAFGQSLDDAGGCRPVAVNSPGETRFGGPVRVGSLATDAGGTTAVAGGLVETCTFQDYGDPVTVEAATTFASAARPAAGAITFRRTLVGPFDVSVNTAADTVFLGGVDVGSLATDAPGATRVNGGLVRTAGPQTFNDPVTVGGPDARFDSPAGGAITFRQALDGPSGATVTTAGPTTFGGPVGGGTPLGSLLATGGGTTTVAGGLVATAGRQQYDDAVTATAGDKSRFAAGTDVQINNDFTAAGRLEFAAGAGVGQTAGRLVAPALNLTGGGKFDLDQPANAVPRVSGAVGGGAVFLSTTRPLTLDAGGLSGGTVRLRTDRDFDSDGRPVNTTGLFVVYPGQDGSGAVVTFDSPATALAVVLGQPDLSKDDTFGLPLPPETKYAATQNVGADRFNVGFSPAAPVFVYGNAPRTPPGDTLLPDLVGLTVVDFRYDGQDGFYVVRAADGAVSKLTFESIEGLVGLSQAAFVVQTGEPRDGTGATTQQYNVRTVRTQNGIPLPGGLQGARLPENPFVVSPALVNPAASTQPPRVAFGDFNGDNLPDLVLANGPGTPPLVTVIDGKALDPAFNNGQLSDIARLAPGQILAQFYAYDPGFQGGVNVAVGRLGRLLPDGKTRALTITTGADEGGGPHVRTFELVPAAGQFTPLVPRQLGTSFGNFFAYEPAFTGGVRVAVADVTGDGVDDLVLTPGAGGGPRVRVFDGAEWAGKAEEITGFTPAYADFFTVEETFRGGLYVAAGKYRLDATRADIVVGAAGGGGPRVMVFDGSTLTLPTPTVLANFFAFTERELNDPLFGGAGFFTGVGGVSFGGRGANGYLDVLASTARGPQLQVRRFVGGKGELARADTLPLTDPGLTSLDKLPVSIPRLVAADGRLLDPDRLNYGATVGGFVV